MINPGDYVAFSSSFLKSIAESPVSPKWGDRGRVQTWAIPGILLTVRWDHGGVSDVHVGNLQRSTDLTKDDPVSLGNAWVGMGFQKRYGL